jgi:hypothetical protein
MVSNPSDEHFADIPRRIRESLTPRAQMGLLVLAALAGLYALAELDSAAEQLRQELGLAQRQLATREAALEQIDWASLASEADIIAAAIETRFWRAPTEGIASARIQGALEASARRVSLAGARVTIVRARELPDGLVVFEAELSAQGRSGSFAPLLEAAASAEGDLRATFIDWTSANRRFTVRFLAPALIEPDA